MKRIFTALSILMALIACFAMPAYALNTPTTYAITVQSVRTGEIPDVAETVTYYLQAIDDAPMPSSAVNGIASLDISANATKTGSFDAITYTAPDVYEYLLWQQAGSSEYAGYERTICRVKVYVVTDQDSVLSVAACYSYVNATGYKDDFSFSTNYDYPAATATAEPEASPSPSPRPATVTAAAATAVPEATEAPTPTTAPAAVAAATAAPTVTPVTIEDASVALEDGGIWQTLQDMVLPLASLFMGDNWALFNLILAIVTVAMSITLLVGYFMNRKAQGEGDIDADVDTTQSASDAGAEAAAANTTKRKNKGFARAFSILPALVSIVLFLLTEDMSKAMVLIDQWTLAMVLLLLIQVFVALTARKRDQDTAQQGD